MKIQFGGYDRDEILTNFPALVVFGEGSNGFSYSQMTSPSGGDLRFMNSNETVALNYEVEQWDPNYDPAPTNIAGLVLWLKADAGVQTNSDGYVSSWSDQSGYSMTASQGTTEKQPLYVRSAINGQPAIRFDGINDQITWSSLPAQTIFVVNRVAVGATVYAGLIGLNNNDVGIRRQNSTTWYHPGSWNSGNYGDFTYSGGSILRINGYGRTTMAEDSWHIVTAVRGGGTFNVDSIGGYYSGREFGGDYAEVIVYNRALTFSEQNRVGWYLAQKYGLNTYYTQPAGQSYVWVQVPELVTNGYIWAYWGGSDTNPPACTMNGSTWDSNYKGVWHMNQPNAKDSTANANNATSNSVSVVDAAGAIGGAQVFNGNGQISMPTTNTSTLNISGNKLTQSAWINPAANVANGTIATRNGGYYFQRHTDQKVQAYQYGTVSAGYQSSTDSVPLNAWTHVAYSYDGANLIFYINGVWSGSTSKTGSVTQQSGLLGHPFQIGGEAGARYWNGLVDEVRVSDVSRSSNWMWACYMNQASNSSFMTSSIFVSNDGGATNITGNSANMRGYLHHSDDVIPTYAWVYYGQMDGGSVATNWQHVDYRDQVLPGLLDANIGSLVADKVYYYRYFASNSVRSAWAATSASFFTGQITVYASDNDASEGGSDDGTFTVCRPASGTNGALVVNYFIDGTAINGVDYLALSGSVTIPAGQTNAVITVIPIEDALSESGETVALTLIAGEYIIGTDSNAVVTIQDPQLNLWWNRMKITFTGYVNEAGEILTNFPALIVLNTNITGFTYESFALPGNGSDLRFGNSNQTTMLNYEIEKWDAGGNSYIWVQVPELVDSNTYIWVYWGNSMVTSAPGYTTDGSTWSNGYLLVSHLNSNNINAASSVYNGSSSAGATNVAGFIAGGKGFNGSSGYVDFGNISQINSASEFSVDMWVKSSDVDDGDLMTKGAHLPGVPFLFWRDATTTNSTTNTFAALVNNNFVNGTNNLCNNNWQHVAFTYGTSQLSLYVDGLEDPYRSPAPAPANTLSNSSSVRIGADISATVGSCYLGLMDEVRISSVKRTSNWVWACWMNQASNSAFMSCGDISYTINASADPTGGTITPSGVVQVVYGGDTNFVISATNAHYHIADVVVDGISVGPSNTYSFGNVTNVHTIVATFALDTYNIIASSDTNGVITPDGTVAVPYGSSQTFSNTPNTGYHLGDVIVDGFSVGISNTYTFANVTNSHTIVVSNAMDIVLTITASAGPNGVISPSGIISVAYGNSTNFVMTPTNLYHVTNVLVDSVSVGASNSYLFVNVTNNRTISAIFSPDYTTSVHPAPMWWLDHYYGAVDYNAYAEMDTDLPPFEIRKSTNLLSTTSWIPFTNIIRSSDGTNYLNDVSPLPTNLPTFYRIVATNTP